MAGRPAIVRVYESADDDVATVTVDLQWEDATFSGQASGSADLAGRPRLVGEAALRAVEAVTEGRLELELAAMATAALGTARVAMAQIRVRGTGETLVGNCLVDQDDPSLAAVKAVMDALNRRLGTLL